MAALWPPVGRQSDGRIARPKKNGLTRAAFSWKWPTIRLLVPVNTSAFLVPNLPITRLGLLHQRFAPYTASGEAHTVTGFSFRIRKRGGLPAQTETGAADW